VESGQGPAELRVGFQGQVCEAGELERQGSRNGPREGVAAQAQVREAGELGSQLGWDAAREGVGAQAQGRETGMPALPGSCCC
jgi:hypothetical protein